MIDARDISKSYHRGVPVLDGVTLSLRRSTLAALAEPAASK
jgi:ABC-type multidrug transport system ATPase subunit